MMFRCHMVWNFHSWSAGAECSVVSAGSNGKCPVLSGLLRIYEAYFHHCVFYSVQGMLPKYFYTHHHTQQQNK